MALFFLILTIVALRDTGSVTGGCTAYGRWGGGGKNGKIPRIDTMRGIHQKLITCQSCIRNEVMHSNIKCKRSQSEQKSFKLATMA